MTLAFFSVGNIVGTEIFLPKDAPDYIPGKIAIMVLLIAQLFVCFLLRWINISMNQKKQKWLEEERLKNKWTDEHVQKDRERHAFLDMTDKQFVVLPLFSGRGLITNCISRNMFFVYTA